GDCLLPAHMAGVWGCRKAAPWGHHLHAARGDGDGDAIGRSCEALPGDRQVERAIHRLPVAWAGPPLGHAPDAIYGAREPFQAGGYGMWYTARGPAMTAWALCCTACARQRPGMPWKPTCGRVR